MSAVSLRVHVHPGDGPHAVAPATHDRLVSMLPPLRWEPMLTVEEGTYRAWLRAKHEGQVPRRIFGRPAPTADEAVAALIRKVEPWAHVEGSA